MENLYKDKRLLSFKECYALEKIHGTSSNITWRDGHVWFSSGGMSAVVFKGLFDEDLLKEKFISLGHELTTITVYGEAYGGKQQNMNGTYGKSAAFIVFDVEIGGLWLDVPKAEVIAKHLGLEFVPYAFGPTTLEWIDSQRDADSIVAINNGMGPGKKREGVVLRPPFEVTLNNGERLIVKHKRAEFKETNTVREVDAETLAVLEKAEDIAEEWVTEMRLTHVLQKIQEPHDMSQSPLVIEAMIEDVLREAKGEIVDSREARKAIGKRAIKLFKSRVTTVKE